MRRTEHDESSGIVARLRAAGCVFAEQEAALLLAATDDPGARERLVRRRAAGEPLEHLLGEVEFGGITLAVRPGVFVPRQRTLFLVQLAAERLAAGAVVVDLCCGCGAIGRAIAEQRPGVHLTAADIDPVSVACARENLAPVGGTVLAGDLFDALPTTLRGRIDMVVANVPYVPTTAIASMPPEARDHEPVTALDGGADGTDLQAAVAVGAAGWLRPGGSLLVEAGRDQATTTVARFAVAGLTAEAVHSNAGDATVVIGTVERESAIYVESDMPTKPVDSAP